LGKIADAANDQDRERYLTALVGRLKLSGDVGLLYKDDAERLIENIPNDLDVFIDPLKWIENNYFDVVK
jgi:hypothetical protein